MCLSLQHIAVADDDLRLQVVKFLDRLFIELSLTFGARSSPGIFDRLSDLILRLCCLRVGVSRCHVVKQLDDVVFIAWKAEADKFYDAYDRTCGEVGVRLAPTDDPDKCFPGTSRGTVLGIDYDTERWSWSFSTKKINSLCNLLISVTDNDTVPVKTLRTISGKLEFYKDVVSPRAAWERGFILQAISGASNDFVKVQCTSVLKSQCYWWIRNILHCAEFSQIPDPFTWQRQSELHYFPDASGGCTQSVKAGMGGVMEFNDKFLWVYIQHSQLVRDNAPKYHGDKLGHKLSYLEGVAALLGPTSMAKYVKNKSLVIHTDNSGLVYSWRKKYSRDPYVYTILLAIETVCRSLNCEVRLVKTPRRSGCLEAVADDLSKGKFDEAMSYLGPGNMMVEPSRTLIKYTRNPVKSRVLGHAILAEVEGHTATLPHEPEISFEVNDLLWKRK